MNWYKRAQINKESGAMRNAFLGFTIPMIALLLGASILDVENRIQSDPVGLAQEIQYKQELKQEDLHLIGLI